MCRNAEKIAEKRNYERAAVNETGPLVLRLAACAENKTRIDSSVTDCFDGGAVLQSGLDAANLAGIVL
jgi:hypothetical protein